MFVFVSVLLVYSSVHGNVELECPCLQPGFDQHPLGPCPAPHVLLYKGKGMYVLKCTKRSNQKPVTRDRHTSFPRAVDFCSAL